MDRRLRSPVTAALLISIAAPAWSQTDLYQRHLYSFRGAKPGDVLGFAVKGVGDVDGDGRGDFAIGAWGEDHNGPSSGAARVYSGRDGRVLHEIFGPRPHSLFGFSVGGCGDIDKDGHDDFIVGAVNDPLRAPLAGSATVFSGKTGRILHVFTGDRTKDLFGNRVAGAGDVDNDGVRDLIVGAPCGRNAKGVQAGYVRVLSGRTGKKLFESYGSHFDQLWGYAVMGLGDLDGDGHDDFLFSAPHDNAKGHDAGSVHVISGKTLRPMYRFFGIPNDHAGRAVDAAGDVDNDGVPDFIYGGEATIHKDIAGRAHVVSGKTGAILHSFNGVPRIDEFAMSVGGLGDVNGDGHSDLFVGAPSGFNTANIQTGYAAVFSGKDGKLLDTFFGPSAGSYFGYYVSGIGDANGDGVPDMIASGHLASANGPLSGYARVISGRTLSLTTEAHEISTKTGGQQRFHLRSGRTDAGKPYLLLGSASGTSPGLSLGSVRLPINPDPYFSLLAAAPNTLLVGSFGLLDANGAATARLSLPSLPSVMIGARLHHAYAVFGSASFALDKASNPVPLVLSR